MRLRFIDVAVLFFVSAGCGAAPTKQSDTSPVPVQRTPTSRIIVHRQVARTLVPDLEETDVRLTWSQGSMLPTGDVGFGVIVQHWQPHGEINLHLVGPRNETLAIASSAQRKRADGTGNAEIPFPLHLEGLYPGKWVAVVDGASGKHEFAVDIPVMEPCSIRLP